LTGKISRAVVKWLQICVYLLYLAIMSVTSVFLKTAVLTIASEVYNNIIGVYLRILQVCARNKLSLLVCVYTTQSPTWFIHNITQPYAHIIINSHHIKIFKIAMWMKNNTNIIRVWHKLFNNFQSIDIKNVRCYIWMRREQVYFVFTIIVGRFDCFDQMCMAARNAVDYYTINIMFSYYNNNTAVDVIFHLYGYIRVCSVLVWGIGTIHIIQQFEKYTQDEFIFTLLEIRSIDARRL